MKLLQLGCHGGFRRARAHLGPRRRRDAATVSAAHDPHQRAPLRPREFAPPLVLFTALFFPIENQALAPESEGNQTLLSDTWPALLLISNEALNPSATPCF